MIAILWETVGTCFNLRSSFNFPVFCFHYICTLSLASGGDSVLWNPLQLWTYVISVNKIWLHRFTVSFIYFQTWSRSKPIWHNKSSFIVSCLLPVLCCLRPPVLWCYESKVRAPKCLYIMERRKSSENIQIASSDKFTLEYFSWFCSARSPWNGYYFLCNSKRHETIKLNLLCQMGFDLL